MQFDKTAVLVTTLASLFGGSLACNDQQPADAVPAAGDPAVEEQQPAAPRTALLEINGTELFVKRIGSGEPIIVVHGGPVLEHSYLLPHLEPLAKTHELIFYDQRLSGRSAGTVEESSVTIAAFVEDIEQLRQALNLGRVHLLGHSWGGLLAMHYAIDHGEHLASLMLVDPVAGSSALWQQEQKALGERIPEGRRAAVEELRKTEAFQRQEPAAVEEMLRLSFQLQFKDPSLVAKLQMFIPDDYAERSRQFGVMVGELMDFDLHGKLAAVEVPTLVLFGSEEAGLEIGGKALDAALPNSRLVVIENSGHFPFVEAPEEFLRSIETFLGERN